MFQGIINFFSFFGVDRAKIAYTERELAKIRTEYNELLDMAMKLSQAHTDLEKDYKALVRKHNQACALGKAYRARVREFEAQGKSSDSQFTIEELKRMLRLCHPDKHGGKKAAVEVSQKLNSLIQQRR